MKEKSGKSRRSRKSRLAGFLIMGAAVLALTALLMKACNYLLVDDTSSYTRLTMHELY